MLIALWYQARKQSGGGRPHGVPLEAVWRSGIIHMPLLRKEKCGKSHLRDITMAHPQCKYETSNESVEHLALHQEYHTTEQSQNKTEQNQSQICVYGVSFLFQYFIEFFRYFIFH
jgi:hypothetical protein